MANAGNRLIYILKCLHEYSDGEHYLTIHQIIEHLESLGIHTHRQTVISDIDEIKRLGVNKWGAFQKKWGVYKSFVEKLYCVWYE